MESRNKEILKTSVVIGGNVGNLFAGAAYMISSSIYYNQTQSGLMSQCADMLSPKYIVPVGYVVGAALGFTMAAGYQFMYAEKKLCEEGRTLDNKSENEQSINMRATLFGKRASANNGTLKALHDKFGKSKTLNLLNEQAEIRMKMN